MTQEETNEVIKVMSAYVNGKKIQYLNDDGRWVDTPNPLFDWSRWEYRIKPEPNYRPFKNAEECWQEMQKHHPFGWIKRKEGYFNIVYVNDHYAGLSDKDGSAILLSSKNSYQDNSFADGTPFGIKED